jgi:hypothetical protein
MRELFQGISTPSLTATSSHWTSRTSLAAAGTNKRVSTPAIVAIRLWYIKQPACLKTNKRYIGNTQQHVKTRMQGHIQDVKNLFINDKSSDLFASHFAALVPAGTAKKNVKDFVKIKVDILWQGDPLSCLQTFGTRACKLCLKEQYAIIKLMRETP